ETRSTLRSEQVSCGCRPGGRDEQWRLATALEAGGDQSGLFGLPDVLTQECGGPFAAARAAHSLLDQGEIAIQDAKAVTLLRKVLQRLSDPGSDFESFIGKP